MRVVVAGFLLLPGALAVHRSRAVEWMTADKFLVLITNCQELVEYHDPGLWCSGENGGGIAGADRADLGHRVEVVRVLQPRGAPGHPDASDYTWSDWQSGTLAIGSALIVAALATTAWPATARLRRRRVVGA